MLKGDFTQEASYTAMFYVANIKYALCSRYTECTRIFTEAA
jgi:hypothetical protein